MKKIFVLGLLIAPIMAHATDPVGPSAVGQGETPVIATASAPYATATAETGDSTTVVSASYVKGAYNDAIAAVNKVNSDKQDKLVNGANNHNIESKVIGETNNMKSFLRRMLPRETDDEIFSNRKSDLAQEMGVQNLDDALVSADVFFDGMHGMTKAKQRQLQNRVHGNDIASEVVSVDDLSTATFTNTNSYNSFRSDVSETIGYELEETLISTDGVIDLIKTAVDEVQGINNSKRVSAVTTWGDDAHPTQLQLTTASN